MFPSELPSPLSGVSVRVPAADAADSVSVSLAVMHPSLPKPHVLVSMLAERGPCPPVTTDQILPRLLTLKSDVARQRTETSYGGCFERISQPHTPI